MEEMMKEEIWFVSEDGTYFRERPANIKTFMIEVIVRRDGGEVVEQVITNNNERPPGEGWHSPRQYSKQEKRMWRRTRMEDEPRPPDRERR